MKTRPKLVCTGIIFLTNALFLYTWYDHLTPRVHERFFRQHDPRLQLQDVRELPEQADRKYDATIREPQRTGNPPLGTRNISEYNFEGRHQLKTEHHAADEVDTKNTHATDAVLWIKNITDYNITRRHELAKPFFLTAVLHVRIYPHIDKANWTVAELKQWIHYQFLAGVEHIFLCNHFRSEDELVKEDLKVYVDLGLMTYIRWEDAREATVSQLACYQHVIDNYKSLSVWQIAVDMDEYPWSERDHEEGFLKRYITRVLTRLENPQEMTQLSMQNYLMHGHGDRSRDLLMDRINRITPMAANNLVKPLYRTCCVRAEMHHNAVLSGVQMDAEVREVRLVHYWGDRLKWTDNKTDSDLIRLTVEMNDMREVWVPRLRQSLLYFNETGAFSRYSGP